MKMNKTLLAIAIMSTAISAQVVAQDTVRLVVSPQVKTQNLLKYNNAQLVSMQQGKDTCIQAPNGAGNWCVAKSGALSTVNKIASQSMMNGKSKITPSYKAVTLNAYGYSANEVAALLTQSGQFGLVEVDEVVSTPKNIETIGGQNEVSVSDVPYVNDPDHIWQPYFKSERKKATGMNLIALWSEIEVRTKNNPIDVIVLDSGFYQNDDMVYDDGRGFSQKPLVEGDAPIARSDSFAPLRSGCTAHGLGVAGTIGATMNNGIGIAGMTNNVNIHAIATMQCGSGLLSDSADALLWLAGASFEGVTPYQGKPGVVNLSLGTYLEPVEGYTGPVCPVYMQSAINVAKAAGFSIVIAAGNHGKDVKYAIPANCDGVIAVGALMSNGDIAPFSNTGKEISLMANGIEVVAPGEGGELVGTWAGTSFSTPLVAGMLAIARQASGIDADLAEQLLILSAQKETLDATCASSNCGAGLPDAKLLLDLAMLAKDNKLNTITHALGNKRDCDTKWFLDFFGSGATLCDLYEVNMMGGYIGDDSTYKLVSIGNSETWLAATPSVVGEFNAGKVMLQNIDADINQYGFQICKGGSCGKVVAMNIADAVIAKKPLACLTK
jgi:serine protease